MSQRRVDSLWASSSGTVSGIVTFGSTTHGRRARRAHTGRWTKGRTPEAVIGKVKMWSR